MEELIRRAVGNQPVNTGWGNWIQSAASVERSHVIVNARSTAYKLTINSCSGDRGGHATKNRSIVAYNTVPVGINRGAECAVGSRLKGLDTGQRPMTSECAKSSICKPIACMEPCRRPHVRDDHIVTMVI